MKNYLLILLAVLIGSTLNLKAEIVQNSPWAIANLLKVPSAAVARTNLDVYSRAETLILLASVGGGGTNGVFLGTNAILNQITQIDPNQTNSFAGPIDAPNLIKAERLHVRFAGVTNEFTADSDPNNFTVEVTSRYLQDTNNYIIDVGPTFSSIRSKSLFKWHAPATNTSGVEYTNTLYTVDGKDPENGYVIYSMLSGGSSIWGSFGAGPSNWVVKVAFQPLTSYNYYSTNGIEGPWHNAYTPWNGDPVQVRKAFIADRALKAYDLDDPEGLILSIEGRTYSEQYGSGIKIHGGSGGLVVSNGNDTALAPVAASEFVGSGAQLTGIPPEAGINPFVTNHQHTVATTLLTGTNDAGVGSTLDLSTAQLSDLAQVSSVDGQYRLLKNTSGSSTLNWDTKTFPSGWNGAGLTNLSAVSFLASSNGYFNLSTNSSGQITASFVLTNLSGLASASSYSFNQNDFVTNSGVVSLNETNVLSVTNAIGGLTGGGGITVTSTGTNAVGLQTYSVTGGGSLSTVTSNLWITTASTMPVLVDLSKANIWKLLLSTNASILFTNQPVSLLRANVLLKQDTNGQRVVTFALSGGLLETNSSLTVTTNANALDVLELASGYESTNLVAWWPKDMLPRIPSGVGTTSGGGGGCLLLISNLVQNTGEALDPANTYGELLFTNNTALTVCSVSIFLTANPGSYCQVYLSNDNLGSSVIGSVGTVSSFTYPECVFTFSTAPVIPINTEVWLIVKSTTGISAVLGLDTSVAYGNRLHINNGGPDGRDLWFKVNAN